MLKNGHGPLEIMNKFNISRSTVTNLNSDAEKYLKMAEEETKSLESKSTRPAKYPYIDENLVRFVEFARLAGAPVTQDVIRYSSWPLIANFLIRVLIYSARYITS